MNRTQDTFFRAVIFDLDGTLLDTLKDIADSMNSVLLRQGFPVHDREKYKIFVGDGVEMLVKRVLPQDRQDEDTLRECLRGYLEEYEKRQNVSTRIYEDVSGALNRLASMNIKLAILSNKPHDSTIRCVKDFLSQWSFDMVLGHQDSIPRKPDPAGALKISNGIGIPPERILYLGDTDVDMKTALAAGMYPVGALWGFRTEEELKSNGALEVINHPREILDLIDNRKDTGQEIE